MMEKGKEILMMLVLGLAISMMLAGCGEPEETAFTQHFLTDDSFFGQITDYHFDENGKLESLSVYIHEFDETEGAEGEFEASYEVLLTDETQITSEAPGLIPEKFLAGEFGKVRISGTGQRDKEAEGFVYTADTIVLSEVLTDETMVMPDGEELRVWNGQGGREYKTAGGQTVLAVIGTYPADFVAYPASSLPQEARDRIAQYYQEQGEIYDLEKEITNAYQAFVKSGRSEDYDYGVIRQAPKTLGISEKYIYFYTYYSGPVGERIRESVELAAAFDRSSGEKVDLLSLFTLDPAEVGPTLIRMAGVADTSIAEELLEDFRPEYIMFREDRLGLVYPAEVLPSHPDSYAVWFEYDDNIKSILKPEAVPLSRP